jgi:uncharacterized membrane protein
MENNNEGARKRIKRKRRHHPRHAISEYDSTARIEAFSDGVIAIILTIMVLELKVPELSEHFTREAFWQAAQHLAPKLIAYAMSFIIVAIFWVNHHNFFHSLVKSDGKLLWYNNFLLFWLSLTPFSTAFLGEHPMQTEAVMIFGFILFMAGVSFPLMGYYAMFTADLLEDTYTPEMRWQVFRGGLPGVGLYATSILVAPYNVWISWGIFFIVPCYYFMPTRILPEAGTPDQPS